MTTFKSILITGAGSGFGLLTAQTLAKAGHIVFASMRGIQGKNQQIVHDLTNWAEQERVQLYPLELDILDNYQSPITKRIETLAENAIGITTVILALLLVVNL